jgi:hypothetical protein
MVLASGCGRGGLGDFDYGGDGGDDDTGVTDTSELDAPDDTIDIFDTSAFDTEFDTTGEFDTATFDTFVPPFDTGTFDTFVPPVDTGTFDTFIPPFDTGTFDTIVEFDTSIEDTFVPPDTDFDSSFDTAFDTAFDTGPDGPPPEGGILCGGSFCTAATEECCASFTGLSCVPKGKCGGGTTLGCSSSASCPSPKVCCFTGFGGGTPTAQCQNFCFGGVQLCASDDECRFGTRCRITFGGYGVCR